MAAECPRSASPVSVEKLIEVFRANDISLEANESACQGATTYSPDATNAGSDGLSRDDDVKRVEGSVLCYLGSSDTAGDASVRRYDYPGETETYFQTLNVTCVIYPSRSDEGKEVQIRRVQQALRELTPEK